MDEFSGVEGFYDGVYDHGPEGLEGRGSEYGGGQDICVEFLEGRLVKGREGDGAAQGQAKARRGRSTDEAIRSVEDVDGTV